MGGEADYDEALPGAQTELAPSASETEAHTAWALDDGVEWEPPFWTAGRITAAAAAAAALLTVGAVVVGFWYLRDHETVEPVAATPTSTVVPLPPPVTVTTVVVQQPPTTVTRPAPAPPSNVPVESPHPDDPEFLDRLRANGYNIFNPTLAATRGHQICGLIQRGFSRDYAVQQLLLTIGPGPYADDDVASAQKFVGVATDVYPNCS